MIVTIKTFLKDDSGATAIEYALLATMISLAIIGGATSLGGTLGNSYESVASKFPE